MNHLNSSLARRAGRAIALTPAVLVITAATPALATAPDQWGDEPTMSTLGGERYQPGLAWRNEPEWFAGPSGGVEAAEEKAAVESGTDERGGARAQW